MSEKANFASSALGVKQHQLSFRTPDEKMWRPRLESWSTAPPSREGVCVVDLDDIDDEEPLTTIMLPALQEEAKPADLATPRHDEKSLTMNMLPAPQEDADLATPRHERKRTSTPGAPTREVATLAQAIRSNHVENVRTVLESNPSAALMPIVARGFDPVLCHALRFDVAVPIIEVLLEHNASVDATDHEGRTPLAVLVSTPILVVSRCERGLAIASLLLSAGASAGALDIRGCTPLALAIEVGNAHLAADLINGTGPLEGLAVPAPPPLLPALPELPPYPPLDGEVEHLTQWWLLCSGPPISPFPQLPPLGGEVGESAQQRQCSDPAISSAKPMATLQQMRAPSEVFGPVPCAVTNAQIDIPMVGCRGPLARVQFQGAELGHFSLTCRH
eukprot:NODE_5527_length_1761_cov_4.542840.p1 GENE.NODE_5527_length_1761_cov_4.542840~~NODE_5527_length_1761_cov_4.542840.p1  ORF type:complete len:390 (+),score=39.31 NODE_5527_length_1761_cov_4.542840:137-1306(+)